MESKHFSFIKRAFDATKDEMWISMAVVIGLTVVLSIIFYIAESIAQPEVFSSYWDALVWAYTRYIEGGDGVFDGGPVTVIGKVIASLLGFIGIAIVAIPAGLIGSGFIDAMNEEKHEKKIESYYEPMVRLFKRVRNLSAKEYFNGLPEGDPDKGRKLMMVPDSVPVSKIMIRAGLELKDIIELTQKHPDFRIVNRAAAFRPEDDPEDYLMVTHQPINRPYGYMKYRKSKITIVATSSATDVNTSWFTYYLAKMGGFNYISKEIEADLTDIDSFYAMSNDVKVNGMKDDELKNDKKHIKENGIKLKWKKDCRKEFLNDLEDFAKREDHWLIFVSTSINLEGQPDIHFTNSKAGGKDCTVKDLEIYNTLVETIATCMQEQFNLEASTSVRYPFEKAFVGYRMKSLLNSVMGNSGLGDFTRNELNLYPSLNVLKLNVSSDVVIRDSRKVVIMYKLAQCINKALGGTGMREEDVTDFETAGYGYSYSDEEKKEIKKIQKDFEQKKEEIERCRKF